MPLPFEVRPGGWQGWTTRARGFRLDAEVVEILADGPPRRLPLEEVETVDLTPEGLRLTCRSGARELLWPGPDPALAARLVGQLAEERRRWLSLATARLDAPATLQAVADVVGWAGDPYVRAVDLLLRLAVDTGASDLHLEPLPGHTRVTLRAQARLEEAGGFPATGHPGVVARLKHLAGCHPHLAGISQEGAWALEAHPGIEARLAVFPSLDGERVALRLVRPLQFPGLDSLGWPAAAVRAWQDLLAEGPGLLLVTGPVGSGKTTALYATLADLAREGPRRVVTLEDPVEGKVPGICQASLDPQAGLDLAGAFKHLLRQDPDVLALGEIRDPACLREVLQAGLAGHLVLATFHAASPAAALDRMRQMGAAPDLVAAGLRGMVSLRWAAAAGPRPPPDREMPPTDETQGTRTPPTTPLPRPEVAVTRLLPGDRPATWRLAPAMGSGEETEPAP
ncbi:MAG: Flp pilus assembly complex ATPase component TadA [Candidatus Riflebacteria bacterium]|nr:Flp pilus assembly complex ATPase component TadA [Candidatus Riflebacteria bacterium]